MYVYTWIYRETCGDRVRNIEEREGEMERERERVSKYWVLEGGERDVARNLTYYQKQLNGLCAAQPGQRGDPMLQGQ